MPVALRSIPLRPNALMGISFWRNAMHKAQCKIFVTKKSRSNLDFRIIGWHQEGPLTCHPKIQNFIRFLIILGPTGVTHSFVTLVTRTIAFGVIGLLFDGLLSQAQAASSVTH
jgi:hypothetical protein